MVMIGRSDIAALKATMPAVLRCYGITDLNRNFSSLWREDRDPSCKFYSDTNLVTDFGEGVTLDVFGLVGKVEGIAGFADQVRAVSQIVGQDLDESADYTPKAKSERQLFELPAKSGFKVDVLETIQNRFFDLYDKPEGKYALDYLYGRGFEDADIVRCGLGYVDKPSSLNKCYTLRERVAVNGYVCIPYPVDKGFSQVRYCMLRTVPAEQSPEHKEIRPTGVKSPLFREYLLSEGLPVLYVVEGLLDCLAFDKMTGRPVMALGGTGLYKRLGQALHHAPVELRPRKVVIAMDDDEPGAKCAKSIARDLERIGVKYSLMHWPDGCKDACDVLASKVA